MPAPERSVSPWSCPAAARRAGRIGPDGSNLLVSSLDPDDGTAQVLIVDIATGSTSVFDDVIGANHGAGGLHRAPDGSSYAWADSTAGVRGSVYRIGT